MVGIVMLLAVASLSCNPNVSTSDSARSDTAAASATETASPVPSSAYVEEIHEWQKSRRTRLLAEDGWLSLIGLDWLKVGDNSIGSATTNAIVLPAKVPPLLGIVRLDASSGDASPRIRFLPEEGAPVMLDGKPVKGPVTMTPDTGDRTTVLRVGTIRLNAIVRGGRIGIRVKDSDAPTRIDFKGLDYFPIGPQWRIDARFKPYDPPKPIPITNVLGIESEEPSPGAIVFKHNGKTYRLDTLDGGPDELFVIFADRTTGHQTYGAGRFLYTNRPTSDGRIVLDFNKAYNPPCAFTDFATCPLPPRQNKLPFRVEAGEMKYEGAGH